MKPLLIIAGALALPIGASAQLYGWNYDEISGPPVTGVVFSSDPNFWVDGGTPSPGSYVGIDGIEFDLSNPELFQVFAGAISWEPGGTQSDYLLGQTLVTQTNPLSGLQVGLDFGFDFANPATTPQAIAVLTWVPGQIDAYESDGVGFWEPAPVPEPSVCTLLLLSLPALLCRRMAS